MYKEIRAYQWDKRWTIQEEKWAKAMSRQFTKGETEGTKGTFHS